MSLFDEWNLLLLEEYFSPARANQDVRIPTTRNELEGVGIRRGGAGGLIEAVKSGPKCLSNFKGNIAEKAKELARQRAWPSKRRYGYIDPGEMSVNYIDSKAPTYLPYLAIWILAKSETENTGFYSTVGSLINEVFPSNTGPLMEAVWLDLDNWSNISQKGRFGRFNINILGSHRFVGIAYAQTIITHKDLEGLSRLFGSCGLQSGQTLNQNSFLKLLEVGRNSDYLSLGLKDAMSNKNYTEHLKQSLNSHLEFWDGQVPIRDSSNNSYFDGKAVNSENDELTLILRMKDEEDSFSWEIGWRLPATITGVNYAIKAGCSNEVGADLELSGSHIFTVPSNLQSDMRNVLGKSATAKIDSLLTYSDREGERNERKIYLREDKIRVLVWDSPDPLLKDTLIEREIPLQGPAYLLYFPSIYSNLEQLLNNEKIDFDPVDIPGLPGECNLICIPDISKVTAEQRALILDEEPIHPPRARIRFVGGKAIIGSGSKQYAYYDLPIVEVEAPEGAELNCSGITFQEINRDDKTLIRRFQFSLDDEGVNAFRIGVRLAEEILCTAGLKVLAIGSLSASKRTKFSLDRYGKVLPDDTGLCGATINKAFTEGLNITSFQTAPLTFMSWDGEDVWKSIEPNISAQFLDSIAATPYGSMSYGVARDQIRRLANNVNIKDVAPALLIRELRRRGHVEIECDAKGHMIRVCSVPPTIYSLPITDNRNRQVYGVCGSLRLQQWKELTTHCHILIEKTNSDTLPVVRFYIDDPGLLKQIAEKYQFLVEELPIRKLSQWVGSVKEMKESLSWYHEQGYSPNYLERLNPGNGVFGVSENIMVDPKRVFELFRYEDPQVQGLRVYKLGWNFKDHLSRYSFIEDSRWGVWIAINAFAEFVKRTMNFDDASPWPIHFDKESGCLWLPARMEPPFIIERILTLCSGSSPLLIKTVGVHNDDSISLYDSNDNCVVEVSSAYYDMSDGRWLCYRWVPEKIALIVVSLLGGELKEVGNNSHTINFKDEKCQLV